MTVRRCRRSNMRKESGSPPAVYGHDMEFAPYKLTLQIKRYSKKLNLTHSPNDVSIILRLIICILNENAPC